MTRATPDQISRVVDLYRDAVARGECPAVRTFAPAHGVSANTLYRALDAAGIRTAHKGRGKDGEPRSPTSWRHERPPQDELVDAFAHWGVDGCAEEYGVHYSLVRTWLRWYGVRGVR